MPYTIKAIESDQCIALSYAGEMAPWQLSAARYEADNLLDQKRWKRLLVDATQLQSDPTTLELYDFARNLYSNDSRTTRVALVIRPEQARNAKIVEKLARTRRVFLSYFLDRDKARAWLNESTLAERIELKTEALHA